MLDCMLDLEREKNVINSAGTIVLCDNYVPQWLVELDDELSWLFTNRLHDKWKLREWE